MVRRIVWIFSIAGAVVLAGITAMLFSGQSHIRVPAIAALVTFAAVILSYLGGIEWGLALSESAGTESGATAYSRSALSRSTVRLVARIWRSGQEDSS